MTGDKREVRRMEFKKIREPVLCGRLAYDSSAEQAVESDILLPDYLPDVTRVLGCRAEPRVISCVGEGRRITVDGMTDVEIFYVSEDGRIRRIEQKLAFSKSVESKNELESPVFILNTRVDYLNCRAVSQRRLDLRGAFTVGIKAAAAVSSDVVSEASGCGIQLKSRTVKSYFPVGESRRQLTLREELEAGRGRAPATGVIRCSARCTAADSRIVAGKIVAKGEVWLHILYDTESDGMQSMDCSLPVSQIIDMEGVSEDSVCDVRFEAVSVEVTPSDGDGAGGCRLIDTSAITAMITAASRMMPKIICHLAFGLVPFFRCVCACSVVGWARPGDPSLRAPQCGQRLRRALKRRWQRRQVVCGIKLMTVPPSLEVLLD